ncbi:hypothetical protein RDI58_022391 [Solanum bulbocastanum]|uniref:Uncharacterized protein n=1 Tax=Solanum bulbocastanum TaxID=147425 RepID=A0AAN8Y5Q8_SOLBU
MPSYRQRNTLLQETYFKLFLSKRFVRRTFADPFEVYRALRIVNPSPYMTHIQFKHFLKDPVKYYVKYQACAQPFLILDLLVTALATTH